MDETLPGTYAKECMICAVTIVGNSMPGRKIEELAHCIERAVEDWLDAEAERGR